MPIHVHDFFCGCGGTSAGFRAAGLDIRLGIDIDADAQRTFETNFPEAVFLRRNIFNLPLDTIEPYIVRARMSSISFVVAPHVNHFRGRTNIEKTEQ